MTSPQILKNGWSSIEPADAGWTYVSFAVHSSEGRRELDGRRRRPGTCVRPPVRNRAVARSGETEWTFGGRASVFDGLGWCLYLPRDTEVTLTASTDLELAIAAAPATQTFAPVLVITGRRRTSSCAAAATRPGRSAA